MHPTLATLRFLVLITTLLFTAHASALDVTRDNVKQFINNMVETHNLDRESVTNVLKQVEIKESILEAMRRPAEKSKAWHEYRNIFLKERRINQGVAFWQEHREAIERVSKERGVPPEIIVAIIGVETNYGRLKGSYRVIDALATLAFDYPRRSPFFTKELENFFLLANEEPIDLLAAKGSYAGAMGAPQFMPSSYRNYASDGDADGSIDLFNNWDDVFASIANYFIDHGWQSEAPIVSRATADLRLAKRLELKRILAVYRVGFLHSQGIEFDSTAHEDELALVMNLEGKDEIETWVGYENFYVITRYNHSKMYAMAVHQLGQNIRQGVEALD
ncbi:MAG: lytic murein transglycosylase B [Gammaproteobacteria bacterium]